MFFQKLITEFGRAIPKRIATHMFPDDLGFGVVNQEALEGGQVVVEKLGKLPGLVSGDMFGAGMILGNQVEMNVHRYIASGANIGEQQQQRMVGRDTVLHTWDQQMHDEYFTKHASALIYKRVRFLFKPSRIRVIYFVLNHVVQIIAGTENETAEIYPARLWTRFEESAVGAEAPRRRH